MFLIRNWSNTYMCIYGSAMWILRRKKTQMCALGNLLACTYQCKLNPWHLVITLWSSSQFYSAWFGDVEKVSIYCIMYVYFINKWILAYLYLQKGGFGKQSTWILHWIPDTASFKAIHWITDRTGDCRWTTACVATLSP